MCLSQKARDEGVIKSERRRIAPARITIRSEIVTIRNAKAGAGPLPPLRKTASAKTSARIDSWKRQAEQRQKEREEGEEPDR